MALLNCIVDTLPEDGPVPALDHSIVISGPLPPGPGNLVGDPLFVDPGRWEDSAGTPENPVDDEWIHGDYRLRPGSPAIDAGTPDGAPPLDKDGIERPCGAGVDIGAHEAGDCVPAAMNIIGKEPELVVQDGRAVAYVGSLTFPASGPYILRGATFADIGPGDGNRLVTAAGLWRDDGDGVFSGADEPIGDGVAFDAASQQLVFHDVALRGDPGTTLTYFLVLKLAPDGPSQTAIGAGIESTGLCGIVVLAALGAVAALARALAAGRRRCIRCAWSMPALLVLALLAGLPGGCDDSEGGGSPTPRELQLELRDLDVRGESGVEVIVDGLPSTAWRFSV
jgi:hypothetical protein